MTNIILIDDHAMIREGLKTFLTQTNNWNVIAEASTLKDVQQLIEEQGNKLNDSIAIIDIKLGDDSGLDVLNLISKSHLKIKSLMYSMFDAPGYAMEAINRGAMGYITKASENTELIEALRKINAGETYIQQSLIRGIAVTANLISGLTKKEKEIYQLIGQKYSNQQIAEKLNISLRTTENYVSKIYDKLGINSRNDIIL